MENNGQRGAIETRERHLIAVLRGIRSVNRLIASDDDPERLIERACESLTAAMGYHNAWIALLGSEASRVLGLSPQGAVSATAAAGFNGGFAAMRERLLRGEFPACMACALETGDTRVTGIPTNDCPDCPLAVNYAGRAGLTRRLEFDGVTYGVLSTSVPVEYAKDAEEQELFDELARDLAFGLHKIATARRLEESRRSYRDLFEKHSAAKLIIDPDDGRIVGANAAAAKFYGWSRDELCRMKISDINTLTPAQIKTEMDKAQALERTHFEFEHRRADGSIRDVAVYSSRVESGGKELLYSIIHDITARKEAEEQLVLLGEMLDAAPAAITIHDTDGRFLFSNQQNMLLHGYDSEEEFLALNLNDLDVPESAEKLAERFRLIEEEGSARFEVAHHRKDGSIFPLEVSAKQIEWAKRPAVLSIATDITERKRAEEDIWAANQQLRASEQQLRAFNQQLDASNQQLKATEQQLRAYNQQLAASEAALRLSEEKYRTLVEGSLQGVVIAQAGPVRLTFANTAMESLSGYAVDELTSMGPAELAGLIHPDDRERFFGNFKRRVAGETVPPTAEYRLLRKDGATIWAMCHSSAIDYLGEPATLTVFVDITDRKGAEEALQANYALLQIAGETANFGGWSVDLATNRSTWSDVVADIHEMPHGYSPKVEEGIAFYAPKWRERITQVFTACAEQGTPYDEELQILARTGKHIWVRTSGRAVRNEQGIIVGVQGAFQDITERKRMERALHESKERLDLAMAVKNEGIWDWNLVTNDTFFDNCYYTMAGYAPNSFPQNFAAWADHVHPDDLPHCETEIRDYLSGRSERFDIEFRFKRQDGSWMWIQGVAKIVERHADGSPLRMVGTHTDITERKRAESQLRAEKEWSESLIDHAPNMVIGLQERSKIAVFNRFAERLTGYRAEEVIGKEWIGTFIPEDRQAEIYRVWDDIIDGQMPSHQFENEIITKSGDRRLIAWHNTTITEDGEFRMILSLGEDVTELRRAQHEAAQRERLLSTITTNMFDMVSLTDLEVRCTYASSSHRQLGYEPEELIGKRFVEAIHEEDREGVLSDLAQAMQKTEPRRMLYRMQRADGSYAWLESIGKVLTNDRGEPTGLIFSTRDMTEHKNMQSQIAQADRLASMGMLAAGVAHEINNPLSYVLYNLESLTEDLPKLIQTVRQLQAELESSGTGNASPRRAQLAQAASPAMLDDILARFKDALTGTQRIREVSRGLGTFSRVEQDQLVPINLMHVIDVATNMAFNEIKYRARLVKDYGRNLPTVLASEGRLGQVFLNLIINATHAIDEGDLENNEIRVKTWSEGDSVYAQVKDTGSGIPPENMGKLFDTFFTTKKLGLGSGLGLAISKGIVEGYGGTIEVESEVGVGTCFTVRLPVQSQELTDDDKVQPVASETTTRGRILIVDDEAGIRSAMARMLRGHETVQAASGAEARQILESDQAFDLILCDMMMPEVSGMDLHRWLIEANPGLAKQLIFITGGAFTPHAREYLSQVDNLRLEKPFVVADFKKVVSDRITIVKGLKSP